MGEPTGDAYVERGIAIGGDAVTDVAPGPPLSMADRRAAAQRVTALFPGWSDRAVGVAT